MALIDTSKNCVLFKYGATPAAEDAVNIEEKVIIAPDVKQNDYKEFNGELGNTKSYIDAAHTTTTFTIKSKLRGNDKTGAAPQSAPAIDDLLQASGLAGAAGADFYQYVPNHESLSPAEAVVYIDGKKRSVTGVVSNFKLSGSVGECAVVEFAASGYTSMGETDEANPSVTLDDETLMIVDSVTAVSVDGSTFNLKSFDFDLGNETQDIYAVGLAKFERTDFNPKISLTGYKDSLDTSWADLESQALKSIQVELGNGTGKTVTLTVASALPLTNSESDDSGKLGITKEFRCTKDVTSGNHFELKWS